VVCVEMCVGHVGSTVTGKSKKNSNQSEPDWQQIILSVWVAIG